MVIISWYCIFAITTGVVAMYELIEPVLINLERLQPENSMIINKNTARATMFGLSTLAAPLIFPACLIPSWGERFRQSLLDSLRQV